MLRILMPDKVGSPREIGLTVNLPVWGAKVLQLEHHKQMWSCLSSRRAKQVFVQRGSKALCGEVGFINPFKLLIPFCFFVFCLIDLFFLHPSASFLGFVSA